MIRIPCNDQCECYYAQDKGNTFDCSSKHLKHLPPEHTVPNITDYLDLSNNTIDHLCGRQTYLQRIFGLKVNNGKINSICDEMLNILAKGKIRTLDLSKNNLRRLPPQIQMLRNLTEIELSGNPFVCDCNMLWMKDWLNRFNRTVKTLYRIKCNKDTPIIKLDAVKMGCYPKVLTLWQKILIGLSTSLTITIVILIIIISKRWKEVKWFMFLHFDILDKKDGNEYLDNKEWDALVSYR